MGSEGESVPTAAEAFDCVSDGVVVLDDERTCRYANDAVLAYLDCEREALLGESIWDVSDEKPTRAHVEEAIETGEAVTEDYEQDTTGQWCEVCVHPDDEGATLVYRECTQRRQRERERRRYERIIESLPVGVGQIIGSDGRLTYVNEQLVEMFGADSKETLVSKELTEMYADTSRQKEFAQQLQEDGRIEGADARFETVDGEEFSGTLTAALNDDGEKTEVVGILEDRRERAENRRRIRELHDATRDLLAAETMEEVAERTSEAAVDIGGMEMNGVYLYDEERDALVPTAVSDQSRELLGEPPVMDEGLAWQTFQTGEAQMYDDVYTTEERYNDETVMRTEMLFPLSEYGVLMLGSTTVSAFGQTDVQLARLLASNAGAVLGQIEREQKLREREQQLQRAETLFENARDAFFLVNVKAEEYIIERVNPAYESLTGLEIERIRGQTIRETFKEADAETICSYYDECVETKETVEYVEQLSVPESGSYWETRISPVIIDGEVVRIVGATRNITDRKMYEQQLEQQRDGLELLNQMVRHDIRNDLQVISSYGELLKSRVEDEEREYVDRILTNAETAVELTRTARDLSGTMLQTETNVKPVSIRPVLQGEVDEIRTTYTDAVVTVTGEIPTVTVVADEMLSSVFRNIIKNAIQHNNSEVPTVDISVATRDGRVHVNVADNGPGVPDKQKEVIFGKGEKGLESEGTGIGLYLVNTLIDRYGGDVQVHDNEPEGTVVTVTLERA